MPDNEELFNASVLDVVASQASLEFPVGYDGDRAAEWLARLGSEDVDRKIAFFDENLDFILSIRFPHHAFSDEEPDETPHPPLELLSFLAHLQVSYDASYISQSAPPAAAISSTEISRPPVPPRTTSMGRNGKPGGLLVATHPSIFPPSTPHPIPAAAESDRRYVQAQGTPLAAGVWGEGALSLASNTSEAFALLWAREDREWVAVYKMSVLVLFMQTRVSDPLLCLTVSITLREKPLAITSPLEPLAALIDAAGGLPHVFDNAPSAAKSNGVTHDDLANDEADVNLSGLEEINLLGGLCGGPTFNSSSLTLPSTRLGPATRKNLFSLAPTKSVALSSSSNSTQGSRSNTSSPSPSPSPTFSSGARGSLPRVPPSATMRKSFRKTMNTASGFRVRMRTVFVPSFLLPQTRRRKGSRDVAEHEDEDEDEDDPDALYDREQREAGNEEHTVVLSVEIENAFLGPSLSSPAYSFVVESADVSVGGTGAKTVLVSWGSDGPLADVFPLHMGPREQVNLLYAVSFLRAPEADEFSLAGPSRAGGKGAADKELQRAVTINIRGRPFEHVRLSSNDDASAESQQQAMSFPTRVYPSRWNCVLDLSTTPSSSNPDSIELPSIEVPAPSSHPIPASPFPTTPTPGTAGPATLRSILPPGQVIPPSPMLRGPHTSAAAIAGSKRYTSSALDNTVSGSTWSFTDQGRKLRSPVNYQGATAMLNPANQPQGDTAPSTPTALNPIASAGRAYIPPSLTFSSAFSRSPTTYSAPVSPPGMQSFAALGASLAQVHAHVDSLGNTSDAEPPTPRTPAYPAYPGSPAAVPPTPFWQAPLAQQTGAGAVGPSVEIRRERGGVPPTPGPRVGGFGMGSEVGANMAAGGAADGEPIVVSVGLLPLVRSKGKGRLDRRDSGEIYPLDQFTLDIFVFNQSSWTRRFEVSYPEERRRRRRGRGPQKADPGTPGILPLENRVRIGPLLPSTCQSVRMDFLALTPGVHSIDTLALSDIQSGFTMHLRSVMDIVVHEPYIAPP